MHQPLLQFFLENKVRSFFKIMGNHREKGNKTIDYYNDNALSFMEDTVSADVSDLYERFLSHIHMGGRILDFGCGSGRDTKYFKEQGYLIDAIDGSVELCRIATEYSGVQVKCMDFFDIDYEDTYDGIWACASILHVNNERIPDLIKILLRALKPDGVIYISMKYGRFSGERDGRYFTDMDEKGFAQMKNDIPGMTVIDEWVSEDVRRNKPTKWLNEIIKKA